ncbi:MAG: type II secretion system protein GspG [Planctomycetota bacterium]
MVGRRLAVGGIILSCVFLFVLIVFVVKKISTTPAMELNKLRVANTKARLEKLHMAVIQFKLDTGRFPTEEEGLVALIEAPSDVTNYASGGYLHGGAGLKDGWGNDFDYRLYPDSREHFVIISYGADGMEGGKGYDADLGSRRLF